MKLINQNNMKQTAVEWLEEQLYKTSWDKLTHEERMNICSTAKLIEMDQIMDAYHEGLDDVIPYEYYKNTFKSE